MPKVPSYDLSPLSTYENSLDSRCKTKISVAKRWIVEDKQHT